MPVGKVIEDSHDVTGGHRLPHAMTADITGPADDEHVHSSR